jgi:two-component system, OmpR family, sensor histidine kinase VicK
MILKGTQNVVDAEVQSFSKAQTRVDTYMNYTRPPLAVGLDPIRKAFLQSKDRGIYLRYITEITKENLSYCKELIKIVDEMRHLDAIKGNFMVSESEYVGPLILFEHGKIAPQAVYSNICEVVEQQQYLFDNFWNQAISAEERIKEIEEGVIPVRTRLLENRVEIIKQLKHLNNSANKLSVCSTFGGMQTSYNYLFDSYTNVVDKHRRGDSKEAIRWITNIDKESLGLVKIFLNSGIQIRHVKNMPPMNFGVSDQEIAVTLEKMEGGKMSQSFLISNEPLYINHFNSLFDELWKNGIDAKDRIEDVEQGNLGDIEVIPNSARAKELYLNLVKSANEEVLLIFPTTNAFIRQHKMGVVQLAKEAAQQRNVKVRILMPKHESTEPLVRSLTEEDPLHYPNYDIDVRYYIEQTSGTKATILVADRKHSLVMELRDDSKTTFDEAIGFSTYSDSRPGVLSYVSIFENIWLQTEMYKKVKETERMQKEFIDIAAHELKTPIQPILGLTEILHSQIKDVKQKELLDTIFRNAKKLNRLTEDVLDLTKIESQSLQLHTEQFNLREMILNTIADSRNEIKKEYKDNKVLEFVCKKDIFIEADRGRLNQVVSNLLNNAIKFTNKGIIIISAEKKDTHVVISVKDTGTGIDPEILPRLFTRFATKSESKTGTGLGLFISKSIVEAHGGRIWAENNVDAMGATFTFRLPLEC